MQRSKYRLFNHLVGSKRVKCLALPTVDVVISTQVGTGAAEKARHRPCPQHDVQ
jgi:hypothetical protein